ncbi:MAG: LptE family protein [Bacteroidetes bacterium]|nr:LptE family protein [Bacteroidota bacterium]
MEARKIQILSTTKLYISLVLLLISQSCFTVNYSFTGASISPDVKTVSIKDFKNLAPLIKPTLSIDITEALKDKFVSQTNLQLINYSADLNFEGQITGYNVKPIAIKGGENSVASLNRLTITIKIKFSNIKDPKQDFESSFSRYADFPSTDNLNNVQDGLAEEITSQLIDDIFNKSVANW